jgi:hypothetical protein
MAAGGVRPAAPSPARSVPGSAAPLRPVYLARRHASAPARVRGRAPVARVGSADRVCVVSHRQATAHPHVMGTENDDPEPATYSWPALAGLLDPEGCTDAEWSSACDHRLGSSTWMGGLQPDARHVSHRGHALIKEGQAVAEGLTEAQVRLLRHACDCHPDDSCGHPLGRSGDRRGGPADTLTDAGCLYLGHDASGRPWVVARPFGRFVSALREREQEEEG